MDKSQTMLAIGDVMFLEMCTPRMTGHYTGQDR
jgi:hypothetical protein